MPAQSVPAETAAPSTTSLGTNVSGTDGSVATETLPSGGRVLDITDPEGDIGAAGPTYADAVEVRISDEGANAEVRVRMRANVPLTLADREVIGIGVNIGDWQLFADGEVDGWYAYAQRGQDFVTYTGTFQIAGDTLIFNVPWEALGDPRDTTVDAFVDWSKPTLLNGADSTSDRAPDAGSATLTR